MAGTLEPNTSRPSPSGHGSFHGQGPNVGNGLSVDIMYEGYSITPKESKGRERWFKALTEPIPGTQEDFRQLIQKYKSRGCNALEELLGWRMDGPKREQVLGYIDIKNKTNPERTYALAYLKLEQYPKGKKTNLSSNKTRSIQMLLDCKRKSQNPILTPSLVAPQGSNAINGGSPSVGLDPPRTNFGSTPTSPMAISWSRPEYLPPRVLRNLLQREKHRSSPVTLNVRHGRNLAIEPSVPNESDIDSNDPNEHRSLSPCSTVSSDTIMSSSRKTSSSSAGNGTASSPSINDIDRDFYETLSNLEAPAKIQDGWRWDAKSSDGITSPSRHSLTSGEQRNSKQRPSAQCLYSSTSTQTDGEPTIINHEDIASDELECLKPDITQLSLGTDEIPSTTGRSAEGIDNSILETESDAINEGGAERSERGTGSGNFYEKPAWMNDLRPGMLFLGTTERS